MKTIQEKIIKNYPLILILILATALRLFNIDFQSVWLDEIHTLNEANPNLSFGEVYDWIKNGEQMPPLYFYIMYFLFKIFGYKTIVLRLFSAFVGVGSIVAIYQFTKEIISKRIALYTAILLTVNYFHIYYSQEGRPYIMFFLFTVLAFYWLVRFIKLTNLKNSLLFGLFSALMINSHFFGLFTLFAQYFILLFFIIIEQTEKRKNLFIYSVIAGFVTITLFIPSLAILNKTSDISSFWIQMPTLDVYTQMFKGFFGNSEMVLVIINVLFVLYFIKISNENIEKDKIIENKYIFSFIIFACWTSFVLLIPLIRTYLQVPMIIDRYFIILLPVLLVIIAIGLGSIKSTMIKNSVICLLIIFSLTDIIIVKKYYSKITKTQFREASEYININNKLMSPVVSSLGGYFPFFIKKDYSKVEIINKSLDVYTEEMTSGSIKLQSFWYTDAHNRPYNVSEKTQVYLDEHFFIDKNMEGFDVWTKHYLLKTSANSIIDISKHLPLQQNNGTPFKFGIDKFDNNNNIIKIEGWAYLFDQTSINTTYEILLIKNDKAHRFNTIKVRRDDVTTYFKSNYDLSNSGFMSTLNISSFESGQYQIGILIKDKTNNKEGLSLTDKIIIK